MGTLKGKFRPKHPDKYRGDPGNILYRSSWELSFMRWCDNREDVISWQSEERRIRYYDPVAKKNRIYFPDFWIRYKRSDGLVMEEVIEVKPKRQVEGPPTNPKRRTKTWMNEVKTYITNTAKWKAAAEYCEDRGMSFRLITEQNLNV